MALKKYVAPEGLNGSTSSLIDGEWLSRDWPTVWEFLSASSFEDGSSRVTGTILLFCQGSVMTACLNDRDGGVSAFVSAQSPTLLLNVCEAGLASGALDWRGKPKPVPRKK